mgnify:CR=1 FL=1
MRRVAGHVEPQLESSASATKESASQALSGFLCLVLVSWSRGARIFDMKWSNGRQLFLFLLKKRMCSTALSTLKVLTKMIQLEYQVPLLIVGTNHGARMKSSSLPDGPLTAETRLC